jgi:DNA-binding winged helix-turn-helix (wHTH) protein
MPIVFGDFVFDRASRRLLREGQEVHLGPKAFDLLDLLLSRQPEALSKAQVRDELWPRTFVSDSNLTSLVTELRSALGDDARRPRYVRTVYGFGYAFCGAAREGPDETGNERSPAGRPRIVCQGREVALRDGENLLGRADEAVVRVDSPTVSRRHARILVSDGRATLEDLGSRNGTFLRDLRIRGASDLADGDAIRIGRVRMVFKQLLPGDSTLADSAERL